MNNIESPFKDKTILVGQEKTERYTKSLKDELRGVQTEEDVRLATFHFLKELTKEMGLMSKYTMKK